MGPKSYDPVLESRTELMIGSAVRTSPTAATVISVGAVVVVVEEVGSGDGTVVVT